MNEFSFGNIFSLSEKEEDDDKHEQNEIEQLELKNKSESEEIERLSQISSGFISKSESSEDEITRLTEKRNQIEQNSYQARNIEREKSQDKEKLFD